MKKLVIDGVTYVPEDSVKTSMPAATLKGLKYVIVRTYSAGVFAGFLKERKGKEVTLLNVRRLWYWSGAASLSQLASEGTKKPNECKFPCEVSEIELTEAIEILQVTKQAKESIDSVSVWKQ